MILLPIIFIIGILLLLKCADLFVDGASTLAARLGVSTAIIAFTVVAFGTSLPEVVVSTEATALGNPSLAYGNIIGSNVVNIAFVLALCSFLSAKVWNKEERRRHIQGIIMMFVATGLFLFIAFNEAFSPIGGQILLFSFVIMLFIIWRSSQKGGAFDDPNISIKPVKGYRDIWMTILGLLGVIIGAQMVVYSAEEIALFLGVSDFIIAVTIVAAGTSLPELVTSVVAVMKGKFAISAGNILGTNMFNVLVVGGASALISPISVPNSFDLVLLAAFTLAVLPFLTGREIITRAWGGVLMIGYVFYVLYYAGVLGM